MINKPVNENPNAATAANVPDRPLSTLAASQSAETTKYFFPRVVHLRLQDGELLKFAPGVRNVPSSLHPSELEVLKRSGAKPVDASGKEPVLAPGVWVGGPADGEELARANAINGAALKLSAEHVSELTDNQKEAIEAKQSGEPAPESSEQKAKAEADAAEAKKTKK
jgi:hypothetical protein